MEDVNDILVINIVSCISARSADVQIHSKSWFIVLSNRNTLQDIYTFSVIHSLIVIFDRLDFILNFSTILCSDFNTARACQVRCLHVGIYVKGKQFTFCYRLTTKTHYSFGHFNTRLQINEYTVSSSISDSLGRTKKNTD